MSELAFQSIVELASAYRRRELSPVEVTRAQLERIASLDGELHAYFSVLPSAALEQAARAERQLARGDDPSLLLGVPIGLKDLCATKGVRTTAGTRLLADWIPDHDATVVERLRAAGAVVLGKLAMTEGAHILHHPDYAVPVNPWGRERWSGASSSGSGVAVAAGLCYGALGSDTGGSIRFPSACNGVVGIKPTYGRVPLFGVFPLAPSLDHVGPMTRSVADAAALLDVLAGFDPRDPGALREPPPDCSAELDGGVRGLRIGYDETYASEGVAPEVSDAVRLALDVLREQGAEIVAFRMPDWLDLVRCWPMSCAVECALAHQNTFPSRAEDYGPSLRRTLEGASAFSALDLARADSLRRQFRADLRECFEAIDLIACPSLILPAPPIEIIAAAAQGGDAAPFMKFTAPYDYSGSPTLSLPCGFSGDGLPLSLQLVGRHLEEGLMCRAGHAYQRASDWHQRHPAL